MRRSTFIVTVSALALLSSAGAAVAQDGPAPQPLSVGASISGELTADDAAMADEYRYDDYRISARAGQRFEATMRAEGFDAFLALYDTELSEPLLSDDDGLGEGTNSRLRFVAESSQDYIIRARTLSGLDGGAYALSLTERPPAPRAPRPSGIRIGDERRGELGSRDPETDAGARYDAYSWRARAGDRVGIALASEDFDPVVRIGRMSQGAFNELAMNDDSPGGDGGLNSFLVFTAPEAGDYIIRVEPLNSSGEGAYTLGLEQGPEPMAATAIAIGDTVEGDLKADDGTNEAGLRADAYRFSGAAGQRVMATLSSEAFDTYLQIFQEANGVRTSLGEDDDGAGEGTNSRLTVTLPADGDYVIEARAFVESEGAYTLSLAETAPERPAATLAFGATEQGEITDEDPTDGEGRGYDAYAFSGDEGQRVQVIMRSGDFDTYLRIGAAEGEFAELASDDDGLAEGTDSRLNFTLPSTGGYVLRASPLGSDNDGLYSIELIDRGPQPLPGSILVGATARGTLTEADATSEAGGYYDAYVFHAKADEKLVVTMVSNEFDSLVMVGQTKDEATEFEVLGSDDDSLSDNHAKLEWTAPADGDYELRAGTFGQGETGAYALTVEREP